MKKHKYLKDIGIKNTPWSWNKKDKRQSDWKVQRKKYGFDERELWSLDSTFFYWLYERLTMFQKVNQCNPIRSFIINGEKLTEDECVEKMIAGCKYYFKYSENFVGSSDVRIMLSDEILTIWKECIHSMWL